MDAIVCEKCGSNSFIEKDGYRICQYCDTRYKIEHKSAIDLNDDVQRLLAKCEKEPRNASKYANLILDIDPTNKEALKYL